MAPADLTIPISASPAAPPEARRLSDADLRAIERHNRRVGGRAQRIASRLFMVYVVGPVAFLLVRLAFRVRVTGREALAGCLPHAIFAFRHFYEWDPFVICFATLWTRSILRPQVQPLTLAGPVWLRTRARRAASWLFGLVGAGSRRESGLERAIEVLRAPAAATVSIAPTGPIGRARRYEVKRGIGRLAVACPEVPVYAVAVSGLADVRLGLGLLLRRPVVTIRFAAPFRGREVAGETEDERVSDVCERIRRSWEELERGGAAG
jgi:1-acyl-sn-glycerol-3-phosphate acyltransferase